MTASAINIPATSRRSSDIFHEEDVGRKVPSFLRVIHESFRRNHAKEDLARPSFMSDLATLSTLGAAGPTSTVAIPTARSVASTTKVRMFTTNRRYRDAIHDWRMQLRGDSIFTLVFLDVEYWYQVWFLVTVVASFVSGWLSMYGMAFVAKGDYENQILAMLNTILLVIFGADMVVSLFVSKEMSGTRITDPWEIKKIYFRGQFWLDLLGTIPFDAIVLAAAGIPSHSVQGGYVGLLGLLSLLRLYRMFRFFHYLETSVVVNHVTTTLVRNLVYLFFTTHWAACLFYFIARQQEFSSGSWVGSTPVYFEGKSSFQKYVASLYWSLTTITTIGYGDVHAYTTAEFIFTIFFMMLNLGLGAYFIGSITLLVTTHDRKSQKFRDSVSSLQRYTETAKVDEAVLDDVHPYLDTQRRNDFGNNKIIHNLPISLRRRLLRSVYKELLDSTHNYVLRGPPPSYALPVAFLDALLHSAVVEVFLPMVNVIEKGEMVNELYFIVKGKVESLGPQAALSRPDLSYRNARMNILKKSPSAEVHSTLSDGMPVGETYFFNQTPSRMSYRAGIGGCRMLTITREKFKALSRDFPQATQYMKDNSRQQQAQDYSTVTESIAPHPTGPKGSVREQLDTYKFLQAAANGELYMVTQMLEKGQDIDATDYAGHTALMMAAMNRRKDVLVLLLENGADVSVVSHFRMTALEAATQHMHVDVAGILMHHGAKLGLTEQEVACKLCSLVREHNAALLGCYFNANANVNAADYDQRTALHVAAAEGKVELVKLLLRQGAKVDVKDRWGRTPLDEAAALETTELVELLVGWKGTQVVRAASQ